MQAEVDANTLSTSTAYLAKIRDTLLAEGGVKPANVKLVPLPSNTATCESGQKGDTSQMLAAACAAAVYLCPFVTATCGQRGWGEGCAAGCSVIHYAQ